MTDGVLPKKINYWLSPLLSGLVFFAFVAWYFGFIFGVILQPVWIIQAERLRLTEEGLCIYFLGLSVLLSAVTTTLIVSMISKAKQRNPRIALLISATGAIILALGSIALFSCQQRFDSEIWKRNDGAGADDSYRLRMIDDLMQHYKVVGMSKSEINNLLGTPEPRVMVERFRNFDYVYWLGRERVFGFISCGSEWLCIQFANNKVITARVCQE